MFLLSFVDWLNLLVLSVCERERGGEERQRGGEAGREGEREDEGERERVMWGD